MTKKRELPEIIKAPPDLRWPGGKHVAVVFNVAYEVWSEGVASGIGPMGNPLPQGVFDHNAESYGNYGANAGISRLVGKLDEAGVKANIFTSGALAKRNPEQIKAIVKSGHEIVSHGYFQDWIPSKLTSEEDELSVQKTTSELSEVMGHHPGGWISPRATAGEDTMRRLVKHGYKWQGDVLDWDLPYIQKFPEGNLVAIPLSYEYNDLAHSMRFGRTPQQFIDTFMQALPHVLAAKDDVVIIDVLVHTHCYGRPSCAWAYGELAKLCAERDDIWLTTRGKIADHVLASI